MSALVPLANHLWQSTLFAVAVWLVTLLLRSNAASLRHRLWLATSVKFLVPFSLLVGLGAQFPLRTARVAAPRQISVVVNPIGTPLRMRNGTVETPLQPLQTPSRHLPTALAALWFCGFAGCGGSWFLRWKQLRRALRRGVPLNLDIPVRTVSSSERIEPGVFGVLRPVLLLPEGIAQRLTPDQLRAMVAHEMSHVRRRDNVATAIHMFVEALFWFHPLVWWIERRLIEEQERACDEEVLRQGSDRQVYAESILRICEFYLTTPLICVPGMTGSDLKMRIREIMLKGVTRQLSLAGRLLLTMAALLALAGPVAVGIAVRAQTTGPRGQTFEVASIKARGGDKGSPFPVCDGNRLQIDPGRFIATNTTLYAMITWAYGIRYSCFIVSDKGLLSGGPKWILTDRFDVQATIPADVPNYTAQQLQDGAAPAIQEMLRALLENRFKVAVHRSMKEVGVYELTVSAGGPKLTPPRENDPKRVAIGLVSDENKEILVNLVGNKASMDDFTHVIEPVTHTPVLNHTGLKGEYSFNVKFAVIEPFSGALSSLVGATSPSIYSVFEKQLGLRLAPGKGAVEEWVIDRAEKPTEN
jgi:uncharacterized protein (TIGR03435 family)